jgi:hypothetical protein
MAASITPGEAGMKLEPVEKVVEWAARNHLRESIGLTAINYQKHTSRQQAQGEK